MKVGFIGTGNMGGALAHAAAQSPAPAELLLSNRTPELAVAHGAAYYGLVRRGLGARIRGGTARAFYVGAAGLFAQGVGQHFRLTRLGAVDVVCQRMPSVSIQFKRSVMRPAHRP